MIDFQLSHSAGVRLCLYDISGRLTKILMERTLQEGYRWRRFNVSDLSNGIYICTLEVDGVPVDVQKILVIK